MKPRSRFLNDLSSPELESYLKSGGDTALIPAGAVEMHGPHMPIGTDIFIARALALLIAEETDGIVFPDVSYSWAGATDGFAGTVSIPPAMIMDLVTLILVGARRMGFRRLAVVSIHGTNDAPMTITVRRVYETHGVAATYLNPFRAAATPELEKMFAGDWAAGKEASLTLAALEILGRGDLYTEKEMAYDDPAPPLTVCNYPFHGAVGFYYQDLRHHCEPNAHTSRERGLRYLREHARIYAEGVRALGDYIEAAREDKNHGYA